MKMSWYYDTNNFFVLDSNYIIYNQHLSYNLPAKRSD